MCHMAHGTLVTLTRKVTHLRAIAWDFSIWSTKLYVSKQMILMYFTNMSGNYGKTK